MLLLEYKKPILRIPSELHLSVYLFTTLTTTHKKNRKAEKLSPRPYNEFIKGVFEKEFRKYAKNMTDDLMIFEEEKQFYYRRLPEGMSGSEYLTLKTFQSRDLIDKYIDLVVTPEKYDSANLRRLDYLIEKILIILAKLRNAEYEHNFLRKKIKWRIFKELQLGPDIRRRLGFYTNESKKDHAAKQIIQQISRQIILDLAMEYRNAQEQIKSDAAYLKELLQKDENETIEFKSSMCWDYDQNKRDKVVEFAVAKAVSCFMNAEGGRIIIGIGDDKEILGLEKDFSVLKKPNRDGFELHFTGIINKYLGKPNRKYTEVTFKTYNGKIIAIVRVTKSLNPIFVKHEGKPEFYVRMGNSCELLNVEEASEYIKDHFKEE